MDEPISLAADALSATVLEVEPLTGGNTGQLVSRVRCADSSVVIVKAAERYRGSEATYEFDLLREIELYDQVPAITAWRPERIADRTTDRWRILVMADLEQPGRRLPPWSDADLNDSARGLAMLHSQTLGGAQPAGILATREREYWMRLSTGEAPPLGNVWASWMQDAAPVARAAAETGQVADYRQCVTHGDLHPDNIFLAEGLLRLVDWAQSRWTSPERDAIRWALTVENTGGATAPDAYSVYERERTDATSPEARAAALSAVCGFILLRLGQEAPGSTMRRRLLNQLGPASRWMASVLGVAAPPAVPLEESTGA